MKDSLWYLPSNNTRIPRDSRGFTLVEIIVSMVVVGILAALMSSGIAGIIQGYLFARNNNDTALKGQIAMTRITRELRSVADVTDSSENSITYQYNKNGSQKLNHTLKWSGTAGDPMKLGGNILVDEVENFILSYHNGYSDDTGDDVWDENKTLINVTLTLKGAENIDSTFETRIMPRNLNSDDDDSDDDDSDDDDSGHGHYHGGH